MKYLVIAISSFLLHCCKNATQPQSHEEKQREIETGVLDTTGIYSVDEIGWITHIPEGWEVLTRQQTRKNYKAGKEIMEKSLKVKIDVRGLHSLLNLRKDDFNSFLSTMKKYNEHEFDSPKEYVEQEFKMVKRTYQAKGYQVTFKEDTSLIDGLGFRVLKIKLYSQDREKVILNQTIFIRPINGYGVCMVINHNNEEYRNELEGMLFSSEFTKRN